MLTIAVRYSYCVQFTVCSCFILSDGTAGALHILVVLCVVWVELLCAACVLIYCALFMLVYCVLLVLCVGVLVCFYVVCCSCWDVVCCSCRCIVSCAGGGAQAGGCQRPGSRAYLATSCPWRGKDQQGAHSVQPPWAGPGLEVLPLLAPLSLGWSWAAVPPPAGASSP